jgi:hypothetical protein
MALAQAAGPPPGLGPGGPDGMAAPGGQDPASAMAMAALSGMGPKPSGAASIAKVEEAFDLAYKLVMSALPQIGQWNPKAAREAHAVARSLLTIRSEIRQESPPQPPPDLALGMGMGGGPSPSMPGPAPGGGMPGMM